MNRGQNVVTADLIKAIEQATSVNVDEFFQQWIYRAGAPKFEVAAKWDDLIDVGAFAGEANAEGGRIGAAVSCSDRSGDCHEERREDFSD